MRSHPGTPARPHVYTPSSEDLSRRRPTRLIANVYEERAPFLVVQAHGSIVAIERVADFRLYRPRRRHFIVEHEIDDGVAADAVLVADVIVARAFARDPNAAVDRSERSADLDV